MGVAAADFVVFGHRKQAASAAWSYAPHRASLVVLAPRSDALRPNVRLLGELLRLHGGRRGGVAPSVAVAGADLRSPGGAVFSSHDAPLMVELLDGPPEPPGDA